jgi:hypothetical protein
MKVDCSFTWSKQGANFCTEQLSSFGYLAGLDTTRANLHAFNAALRSLDANRLQVGIKPATSAVVCMRNIVTELRRFATDFASFSHY